jgi:glycosyltransferase involved in cell wall biosynthesis
MMAVLRIGFDGRALTSPAAGVRRYASQLLRALSALREPIQLVMLGGSATADVPAGCERISEPPHPPTNAGWSIVGLPWAARRAGVDVLHAPAYTGPFWSAMPVVLTIHDVSYARHPEWFPYRRDGVRRAFYRRCALSASAVITDSAFSAAEIRAAYGIQESRITVVPLGVEPPAAHVSHTPLPAGVRAPFLLHVGDLHERRNLNTVVSALKIARERRPELAGVSLVLAGVDRGVGDGLREQASREGLGDAVIVLGSVPEPQLWAMYRDAAALLYPSRYEGFGLPLLEAMSCGTPVIASDAASIPEVVSDAGILVDPLDREGWSSALIGVLTDLELHERLQLAGLARAEAFSWRQTASATLDVYRQTAHA